jgi:competence protein ComEA
MGAAMRWVLRAACTAALFVTLVLGATDASASKKGRELVGTINLNTATAEQLAMLPGVGPATARRILEMRSKRPFQRTWEIIRVKGIGPAFFRKHKDRLEVRGETDLAWIEVRRGNTVLQASR